MILSRLSVPLALFATLVLATPLTALGAGTGPEAAGPPVEEVLARELARLDAELDLGTFPDGTGPWTGRLAAALEHRLSHPDSGPVPAPDLMRHLAAQLRGLGTERGLLAPDLTGRATDPNAATADRAWSERLDRLLGTALRLRAKLARLVGGGTTGHRFLARAAPANDSCPAATGVGQTTVTGTTAEASTSGTATCGGSNSSPDVWFVYTAGSDGPVAFDTFGSSFDTVLSVVDRCPGDGRDTELACNDDAAGTTRSRVIVDLTAGQSAWIRLSGSAGASGPFQLTVAQARGIAGIVTRADSGAPLPNRTVDLFNDLEVVASTTTGADGTYYFGPLSGGTYRVGARGAPDFVNELYDDVPCVRLGTCLDLATPIAADGSLISGIDLALSPAASISGTVTDNGTSSPLAGAFVDLHAPDGTRLATVVTETDGTYEVGGLPAGTYYLFADTGEHLAEVYDDLPCEPSCTVTDGTPVTVAAQAALTGIDFALDRLGGISGTVTDSTSGAGAGQVSVSLYDESGTLRSSYLTNPDGSYGYGGLTPGIYHLTAGGFAYRNELYDDLPCEPSCDPTIGTPVTVTVNATTTGIDFALLPLGKISGTVTHEVTGLPLNGIRVVARDPVSGRLSLDLSAADGSYEIDALRDGTYYVRTEEAHVYANELYDDLPCHPSCDLTQGTPFVMTPGVSATGVDFALGELSEIRGTLTDSATGDPLPSQSVHLFDSSGSFVQAAHAGSDGVYHAFELPADTYYAESSAVDHQDELYDDLPLANDRTEGTPIPLPLNTTVTGIDFALDRLAEIHGTVVEAVSGLPLDGDSVAAYDEFGVQRDNALVLSDGSYRLRGLKPGTYYLVARSSTHRDELHDDIPCPGTCDVTTGTPFVVGFGTTLTGADFALDRLGSISGSLRAADTGSALSGFARLYDGDGSFRASAAATASGFTFDALDPGPYYVRSYRSSLWSDDYQDELYQDVPCEPTCDLSLGTPLQVTLNGTVLGVDLVLHRCPADSYATVTGTTFLSVHTVQACETVTAHSGTTVEPGADVTFEAGRTVILGDGFSVESGGSFKVVIEPAWATD